MGEYPNPVLGFREAVLVEGPFSESLKKGA